MAIDTSSWKPQQKQLWNSLPAKVRTEVAQKGPEKAKAWVDQELTRQIDLRGTVGAGKMTGRADKLRGPGAQAEAPKGDPGLLQDLKSMLRRPMAPMMPSPGLSGTGQGGGGTDEVRQAQGLDMVGQGPMQTGAPIRENADGTYDLSALRELDQYDTDPTTMGDHARCSANSTVAGLMVRGKDALQTGVTNTRAAIEERINNADDKEATREAFAHELVVLDDVEQQITDGTLTTNDMNSFADVLYQVHDTNKTDSLMTYEDIVDMQASVGLISSDVHELINNGDLPPSEDLTATNSVGTARFTYNAAGQEVPDPDHHSFDPEAFDAASEEVAVDTFNMIGNGRQATIGVFEGEGTDRPNHIILAGRTSSGEMYVYNPIGDPNYFTGDDALAHLKDRVGLSYDSGAHRDPDDPSKGSEYSITPAVTFMEIRGTID